MAGQDILKVNSTSLSQQAGSTGGSIFNLISPVNVYFSPN